MNTEKYKSRQELADELGISRVTLYRLLKEFGIVVKGLLCPAKQTFIKEEIAKKEAQEIKNFKKYIENKYSS